MAKNIAPEMGMPLNPVMEDLKQCKPEDLKFYGHFDDVDKNESSKKRAGVLAHGIASIFNKKRLTNLINPDACATKAQIAGLMENLVDAIDEKEHQSQDYRLLPFFQMVNSFRLECNNCLNDYCRQRDPAHPVAEVLKRVPEKK